MFNYSARPWLAIGIYLLMLSSLFLSRKPILGGPIDIIPLWAVVILLAAASFFLASYAVDYWLIFSSKFILHEVLLSKSTEDASLKNSIVESQPTKGAPAPSSLYSSDDFEASHNASDAESLSNSSSSSSSSSSLSSLRPRSDANRYLM